MSFSKLSHWGSGCYISESRETVALSYIQYIYMICINMYISISARLDRNIRGYHEIYHLSLRFKQQNMGSYRPRVFQGPRCVFSSVTMVDIGVLDVLDRLSS